MTPDTPAPEDAPLAPFQALIDTYEAVRSNPDDPQARLAWEQARSDISDDALAQWDRDMPAPYPRPRASGVHPRDPPGGWGKIYFEIVHFEKVRPNTIDELDSTAFKDTLHQVFDAAMARLEEKAAERPPPLAPENGQA